MTPVKIEDEESKESNSRPQEYFAIKRGQPKSNLTRKRELRQIKDEDEDEELYREITYVKREQPSESAYEESKV